MNYTNYNGYVLYFSDHRGMLPSTHPSNGGQTPAGVINGESGLEDVVNTSAQPRPPPTRMEFWNPRPTTAIRPKTSIRTDSSTTGARRIIGYGFGINTAQLPLNSYERITVANAGTANSVDCASYNTSTGALLTGNTDQEGMANPVSGARHVLKLVDGGMSARTCQLLTRHAGRQRMHAERDEPHRMRRLHRRFRKPGVRPGKLQHQASDPFWATATQRNSHADTAFGGIHHRRLGHGSVEPVG